MEIIGTIFMLVLLIGAMAMLIFFAYCLIILPLKTALSNSKYSKEVTATIKDIKREDKINKKGFIENYKVTVTCNFEYNNNQEQKELLYDNNLDYTELEIGDTINCLYNKKNNILYTKENAKSIKTYSKILLISILIIILLTFNALYINSKVFDVTILLLGAILFMYCAIKELKTFINIKTKKYIELEGTIINIHVETYSDSDSMKKVYTPEIEYKYEEKEKRHISTHSNSDSTIYNIGDKYKLYYDKKNKKAYDMPSIIFGIILIGMSILFIIGAIITIIKM